MPNLGDIRNRTEYILNLPTGDGYIDSSEQLDDINEAYQKSSYRYDWPEMQVRRGDIIIANVDRYDIQSNFRKFDYLFSRGQRLLPTSLADVRQADFKYAVDKNTDEYILSERPTTASTAFTTSNNETAGSAVVIELDTISGLSVGEEIYINSSSTPEYTIISAIDEGNKTITIKFKNNITSGDKIYRSVEIVSFSYYRALTLLSASGDVPIIPIVTHLNIANYAAYLYWDDKLEDKKAERFLNKWRTTLADAFLSHDKTSTGESNEFSIL